MKEILYYRSLDWVYIYNISTDQLMSYNPPCKDCLIQSMCIDYRVVHYTIKGTTIQIKLCEEFNKFINSNENFMYQYRYFNRGLKNEYDS